jgi:hypothetical protein
VQNQAREQERVDIKAGVDGWNRGLTGHAGAADSYIERIVIVISFLLSKKRRKNYE